MCAANNRPGPTYPSEFASVISGGRTGNSFATPQVAGLSARILSKHPTLTPFQVKSVLHAVADNNATA